VSQRIDYLGDVSERTMQGNFCMLQMDFRDKNFIFAFIKSKRGALIV